MKYHLQVPGARRGRILADSMISHGNECKADIHALNNMTLRPQSRSQLLVQPLSPYL